MGDTKYSVQFVGLAQTIANSIPLKIHELFMKDALLNLIFHIILVKYTL